MKSISLLSVFLAFMLLLSCKKFVDIPPPISSLTRGSVFENNETAAAVLTGLYTKMNQSFLGANGISMLGGLSADELVLYTGSSDAIKRGYYNNDINPNVSVGPWNDLYNLIQASNVVIENASASKVLNPTLKSQLEGESKFLRAFSYFYLVNLYGDIPLANTSDWETNAKLSRSPKNEVYQKIISDLQDAINLLSDKYLSADAMTPYSVGSEERVRPTKWAAHALLARVYLYLGDWTNAEIQSSSVINNVADFNLVNDLNNVFLKNSKEAIWQLMPVDVNFNTKDAAVFVLIGAPNVIRPYYLSNSLLNAFESGDKRYIDGNWIKSITASSIKYYFPYKYKIRPAVGSSVSEYTMILRLAEQYLIRAEARAQLGNLIGGVEDIDMIRNRAGLSLIADTIPGINKTDLIDKILQERRLELFTEWGHRWFDLKRSNIIDSVMSVVTPKKANGISWKSSHQLFPIYISEIRKNPNLAQNDGY